MNARLLFPLALAAPLLGTGAMLYAFALLLVAAHYGLIGKPR